jgi:hypothetical protein
MSNDAPNDAIEQLGAYVRALEQYTAALQAQAMAQAQAAQAQPKAPDVMTPVLLAQLLGKEGGGSAKLQDLLSNLMNGAAPATTTPTTISPASELAMTEVRALRDEVTALKALVDRLMSIVLGRDRDGAPHEPVRDGGNGVTPA